MASRLELSPELVLVSPDLAEVARAALPDRPWEAFLPRPVDPSPAAVPVPAEPLVALAPTVPLPRTPVWERPSVPSPPQRSAPPAPRPVVARAPYRTWRTIALTMIAFAILLVLSSRPVPDAPTFAAERPSGSQPAPTPKPSSSSGSSDPSGASPSRPTRSGSRAASPATSDPPSTPAAPAAPPPATGRGGAVPGGGYVFGTDGRLVVGPDGTTITRFEATTACGTSVTFSQIALSPTGTFSAQRTVTRKGKDTVVSLSGHVAAPGLIRGNLSAAAPGCDDPVRRYAARLS